MTRFSDVRDVIREGKIAVKNDTKITTRRGRKQGEITKGELGEKRKISRVNE